MPRHPCTQGIWSMAGSWQLRRLGKCECWHLPSRRIISSLNPFLILAASSEGLFKFGLHWLVAKSVAWGCFCGSFGNRQFNSVADKL